MFLSRLQQLLRVWQGEHDLPVPSTSAPQGDLAGEQALTRPQGMAIDLATKLMDAHGLVGWRIKFDHARRRAGQCDYTNKTISLSRLYVRHADIDQIRDTILHEIAHALVGPRHGHDSVWRQKAREIGCTATRCHNISFARAKWLMTCPNGCFSVERHRKKSGLVCTTCNSEVEFRAAETTMAK